MASASSPSSAGRRGNPLAGSACAPTVSRGSFDPERQLLADVVVDSAHRPDPPCFALRGSSTAKDCTLGLWQNALAPSVFVAFPENSARVYRWWLKTEGRNFGIWI